MLNVNNENRKLNINELFSINSWKASHHISNAIKKYHTDYHMNKARSSFSASIILLLIFIYYIHLKCVLLFFFSRFSFYSLLIIIAPKSMNWYVFFRCFFLCVCVLEKSILPENHAIFRDLKDLKKNCRKFMRNETHSKRKNCKSQILFWEHRAHPLNVCCTNERKWARKRDRDKENEKKRINHNRIFDVRSMKIQFTSRAATTTTAAAAMATSVCFQSC